jgi:Tol biopolymer transport system component
VRRLALWLTMALTCGSVLGPTVAMAKAPGPNGRILYTYDTRHCDDCHLTTIDPDGTDPVEISDAFAARWSPDGTRLVTGYLTDDGRIATVVMDADGSNRTEFDIPDPTLNLGCAPWFPDGATVLCEGWDDVHRHRAAGLFTVDASDGSDLTRLTRNPFGGHDLPGDVSPDGERVVFLRENPTRNHRDIGLFVAEADGSDPTRITGWLNGSACCQVSWSPDGSTILFAHKGRLRTIAPDGTGSTPIELDVGEGFTFAFQPGWSPDGTRIVFCLYVGTTDQVDLFTAAADGSNLVQLTDTPQEDGFPDWGPAPVVS